MYPNVCSYIYTYHFCFFYLFGILATQLDTSNTDLPIDLSKKGNKRVCSSNNETKDSTYFIKSKKRCTELDFTTKQNISGKNKTMTTNNSFLNLSYCEIKKKMISQKKS